MGILYPDDSTQRLIIRSVFCFYGHAADDGLSRQVAIDIEQYWNEPQAVVRWDGSDRLVYFDIEGRYCPDLKPEDVWYNDDPSLNFFRIEEYCSLDVSFVDDIGCNTGYFKLANLLHTGTTAAHEYGHTLGLNHPERLDIRGQGVPGIMYPRGTIVDARFQYNPAATAGDGPNGGTMDAAQRRVTQADIDALRLHRYRTSAGKPAYIGGFSSIWHEAHKPPMA